MDSKNVIAAIALSSAVIVLYSLFFVPEQSTSKQNLAEKNKIEQNSDTPSLDEKESLIQISREVAEKLRKNVKVDWSVKASVRARLRLIVKNLLKKHGYPPDAEKKAIDLVLLQAEQFSTEWAVN